MVGLTEDPGEGPRLQDVLADEPLEVTVHEDFGFWLEGTEPNAAAKAGLEHANEAILPTVRLEGLEAAYWVRPSDERAQSSTGSQASFWRFTSVSGPSAR